MDPALRDAAENGDVNFLREAVSLHPPEYFNCRCRLKVTGDKRTPGGNILHIAAFHKQEVFLREAMKLLPKGVVKELLFQTDLDIGGIPLHPAAVYKGTPDGSHSIVKLLLEYYTTTDGCAAEKPWLKVDFPNMTPLHVAIKDDKENEKCAMLLLSMDAELSSCSITDNAGNSVLYYALKNGCNQVAEKILMSPFFSTTSFATREVLTPFHLATNCSGKVLELLFKNFVDCIDKTDDREFSVLHQWAVKAEDTPYEVLFNLGREGDDFAKARTKIFKEKLFSTEKILSDTPLHIAARNKQSEIAQILVKGYQQEASKGELVSSVECPPWNIRNKHGDTPLHLALYATHEELAREILSIDPTSLQIRNNKGESPFFIAVASGCDLAVDLILRIEEPRFQMLRRNDGTTVLHSLSACREQTGRRLLEKYWWMINLCDDSGKKALDFAKQANTPWLVSLLTNPSLIKREKFDWVEACKREETEAVLAFIDHYQELQRAIREENDTPLHHIKLPTYQDYLNFLKIPSIGELKNITDRDGATPLHRALERKDMVLSRILLLDDEVDRNIPDRNGITAMDLLAKLYRESVDWEKMCKKIKVNPLLKTSYIQPGTNLDQMRNTLSVVAALLATITFAAGFTLPGGIDSNTGNAILAKKAAFLVFLLADVYAMCTSMLVLFCLIWSMISDYNMSRVLVDRSVFILMQSLYGTLLAFMTGVYTVISSSSLWAAILVFVMCSIIGISANRSILHYVVDKLIPAGKKDSLRSLEEGNVNVDASLTGKDTSLLIQQSKSTM